MGRQLVNQEALDLFYKLADKTIKTRWEVSVHFTTEKGLREALAEVIKEATEEIFDEQ